MLTWRLGAAAHGGADCAGNRAVACGEACRVGRKGRSAHTRRVVTVQPSERHLQQRRRSRQRGPLAARGRARRSQERAQRDTSIEHE